MSIPILHFGGWFDAFLGGTLAAFKGIRANAAPAVRDAQRLVIGPWIHGPANVGQRTVGEVEFGEAATEITLNPHRLAWYDRWLKGEQNGADQGPLVRVFVKAGQANTAKPAVRLQLFKGGSVVKTYTISAPGSAVN